MEDAPIFSLIAAGLGGGLVLSNIFLLAAFFQPWMGELAYAAFHLGGAIAYSDDYLPSEVGSAWRKRTVLLVGASLWAVGYFSPSILIILGGVGAGTFYWSAIRSSNISLPIPAIVGEIIAAVLAHIVAGVHCTYNALYVAALPTILIILIIAALAIPVEEEGEEREGDRKRDDAILQPDAAIRDILIYAIILAPIFRFPLYTPGVSPALVLAVSRWGALVGRLCASPWDYESSILFWTIAVLATIIGWFVCPHAQPNTLALSFFLGLACGGASSESIVPTPWQFMGRAIGQTFATAVGELAGGYAPQIVAIVLVTLVVAWDLFDYIVCQKE
jgi:hypothetical protein